MFDQYGQGGVFDSWIERWRIYRGIDRWPIVHAKVISKEFVDGGEGGYYKLTLKYRVPAHNSGDQVLTVVTLSADEGSTYSGAEAGDIIELRAHPLNPQRAVFADTSQSASRLMIAVLFTAVFLLILVVRGCKAFFADPH